MKKLMVLILVLIASQNIFAQSGWQRFYSVSSGLNSIYFLNQSTGMACGKNGILLKTTNGGNNWLQQEAPGGEINDIIILSSQIALIGLETNNEIILRTTNNGLSWDTVYHSNSSNGIANFSFPNDSIGYAISFDRTGSTNTTKILKTTNKGLNWSVSSANFSGKWIEFLNPETGWSCGNTYMGAGIGTVHIKRTTDGGNNWLEQSSTNVGNNIYNKIFIKSPTEIFWAWTDYGRLYKTENGGTNWVRIDLGFSANLKSISFINSSTGWMVCSQGIIAKTTNGGINWEYSSNGPFIFNKILFVNNTTGWLVSSIGDIFRTTNGGTTLLGESSSVISHDFYLSQNYPNPFNPSTRINYELKITNYVSLKVFDMLGKEVATLVNEKQNAGSYAVDFNSAEYNLPSGIYFYTLSAGEFKETRKMVLIK